MARRSTGPFSFAAPRTAKAGQAACGWPVHALGRLVAVGQHRSANSPKAVRQTNRPSYPESALLVDVSIWIDSNRPAGLLTTSPGHLLAEARIRRSYNFLMCR